MTIDRMPDEQKLKILEVHVHANEIRIADLICRIQYNYELRDKILISNNKFVYSVHVHPRKPQEACRC